MYFELSEEQLQVRESLRRAMASILTPDYLRKIDQEGTYPYEAYDAWVQLGLTGCGIPTQYGGTGGSIEDLALISEALAYFSYDVSTAFMVSLFTGMTLLKCGRSEQKAALLPQLVNGEIRMSVCISEPEAGSDVGAIKTRAVKAGNKWVLNGQKLWVTAAGARKSMLQIYARTDANTSAKKGMSVFLVPNDTPGIECRKLEMLGRRAAGSYEIFITDVRVPETAILGEVNRGWEYLLAGLQAERALTSSGYAGAAQKVVDIAFTYASERKQFGKKLGEFQAIAHMLADMQTEVDAARLLAYRAAGRLSRGLDASREVSMAKLFGSETYIKVANQGMQILGAYGYSLETEMQRHFRDARSTTIGAGSSQMQRNTIATMMGL
ncbi:acyl-CoA dehydrogenase [Candidimonas sp. SYP-B2681]|uniref:acyl-CoA dehydrogenase family protein n=1 Tax=Candidimonas sp. SYP-B2681 TaxID=2497686 RepID=UPI000F85BBFE|nr:acyl-CoA dehydrogenase family protein [Candidimonas sp. SYP-B2681]RTZ43200.1 acyl-CoA dehydrogenase [Candidimonas sp. SYP-B2681]